MVGYKTNGKCKAYIRKEIIQLIKDTSPTKVLTLPNLNFEVENVAIKKKATVVCCEIDKKIFSHQKKIANKKIQLKNELVSNVISTDTWDLAWVDSCGPASEELFSSINNAKISKKGIFIITIGAAREHHNYRIGDRISFYTNLLSKNGLHAYKIYKYKDHVFPMLSIFCTKKPSKIEIFKLN